MALVLPFLRLWLLFINVYGTFKIIKPPAPSTRSNRNGQGLSARALQLRKRELKSRLAMWIVWACFLASETVLDRTASFVTPFYSELKCVVLLFLLITRSHGAEAIFLHLIHPFIRPYVPAVDDILSHLHSVSDLLILLLLVPFEYVSQWWSRPWRLPHLSFFQRKKGKDLISDNHSAATATSPPPSAAPEEPDEGDNQIRSRLRPRTQSQRNHFQEAEQCAKIVFDQINEAQDRVRVRTRPAKGQSQNQPAATSAQVRDLAQQSENGRSSAGSGLRTRKNFLGQSAHANPAPGSKTTGVHHLDPLKIAQLAKAKPSTDNDKASSFYSLPPPTSSSTQQVNSRANSHEISIPPSNDKDTEFTPQPQSRQSPYRSPSPVYPPFPSAYPFTPRRRTEPLQTAAPNFGTPGSLPRRSTSPGPGTKPQDSNSKRKSTIPPASSSSTTQQQEYRASDGLNREDFFQMALESESSIHQHQRPDTMDVDTTETLSTLNDSSATEGSTYEDIIPSATVRRRRADSQPSPVRNGSKRKGGEAESLKRSLRIRANGNGNGNGNATSVSRDEFGFAIPSSAGPGPGSKAAQRRQPVVTHKKSLARAKPSVNSDGEVISEDMDSENVKKKRKTKKTPTKQPSVVKDDGPMQNEKTSSGKTRITRSDTIDASVSFRSSRSAMNDVAESLKTAKRKS